MSLRTTRYAHAIAVTFTLAAATPWLAACQHGDGGSAANGSGGKAGAQGSSGDRVVPVQVATVEQMDLPIWLEGIGTVAAFQQVTVHTQVDGLLEKVLFAEGEPVKAGQVIAEIDPRPFIVQLHDAQGALARDRAQRDSFKRDYDRDLDLRKQNLIAQVTVDDLAGQLGQAEGAMKIDQSQIELAQLDLDYAQVKSPLDGIAGVRQVDAGNVVHASDANGLVVITKVDPAAVFFTVPQDKLTAVAAALARGGIQVQIFNHDGSEKLAEGDQAILDNQINTTTAQLRIKAIVKNDKSVLWPNAFVKARLLLETRKDALVVPAVAIQEGPNGPFVYVVENGTAQMKPVTIEATPGDLTVITKGVAKGDQVVIEGQAQLRPGGRVVATQPGASSGGPPSGSGGGGPGGGSGSGAGTGHRRTHAGSGGAPGPTAAAGTPAP